MATENRLGSLVGERGIPTLDGFSVEGDGCCGVFSSSFFDFFLLITSNDWQHPLGRSPNQLGLLPMVLCTKYNFFTPREPLVATSFPAEMYADRVFANFQKYLNLMKSLWIDVVITADHANCGSIILSK
ncbi:unnamed protein product [Ascophyllum nodosum]